MATDQSRKQKEVIAKARTEGKTVHFESSTDVCHLKNSELDALIQNTKVEWCSEVTVNMMTRALTQYLHRKVLQRHK